MEMIYVGQVIMNVKHEDWGGWVVEKLYDKDIWEIRGKSGVRLLFKSELNEWTQLPF